MEEEIGNAHNRLVAAFRNMGCALAATTGVIDGMTVRDHSGRYLFAWHTHPHHLLFYLRKPALKSKSTLRQRALALHGPDSVSQNRGEETKITLRSVKDTELLLSWLLPELPLP